jgi:hypothetical protein
LNVAEFIHEMQLSINGKPVDVPGAAIADLVGVRIGRSHFLWERGNDQVLLLEGADAGESYEARFTIRGNRVVEREAWHGEFPEMPHEIRKF